VGQLARSEEFEARHLGQIYGWVSGVFGQQCYGQQGREAKGLLRRYLAKMTGMSRAQITRLIARYGEAGELKSSAYRRHRFASSTREWTRCIKATGKA
jgi:hypothetical protein